MKTLTTKKLNKLKKILIKYKKVLIAFSGGVDSTFLLKVAIDSLGKENVIAVTAKSATYPRRELIESRDLAKYIGADHLVITTKELESKCFKANPPDRCYYCKSELFKRLKSIAKKNRIRYVLDATNYDDRFDLRYGRKAASELAIKSPLFDTHITKSEIRALSKAIKLPTFNKPSFACLASRIPYYDKITRNSLSMVERGEEYIKSIGVKQVRVRKHGDIARIEVMSEDFDKLIKNKARIINGLKELGFKYITLDLLGYRTGSMNEIVVNK